jgi:membrane protease subunit HflK
MSDLDQMKHEPPRTTEQVVEGKTPPPPPAHPNPAVIEESGSRALSEALQSSFFIVKILMVLLVVLFFASGVFTVPSQQRAIVLRFGKPVGVGENQLLGPGLHFGFPAPIDEVVRIPVGNLLTVRSSAGWYQTTPEAELSNQEPEPGPTLNPAIDGYTITSDGNIMHARATVQYRITDPLNYVLAFRNASNVVQSALDNALFYASSQYTVTQATREEIQAFKETVLQRLRNQIEQYHLGISIEGISEFRTTPPRQVRQAFEQVTVAEIERRKARDDAEAYAARSSSEAQGEASAIVNEGQSDAVRLLQQVSAEARYFTNQLASYQANPELFRARVQADAMARVMSESPGKVFTLPQNKPGLPSELRLLLNRQPLKPRTQNEQNGQNGGK